MIFFQRKLLFQVLVIRYTKVISSRAKIIERTFKIMKMTHSDYW